MICRSLTKNGWIRWDAAVAVGLPMLALAATLRIWGEIVSIAWRDPRQNHIFLVPLATAWLVWVRRERFLQCRRRGTLIGPVMVALGWAAIQFGPAWQIEAARHLGALLIVCGCVLAVMGTDVLVRFLPAFLVLLLIVPVPGVLRQIADPPLQRLTTAATVWMFEGFGVAVEQAGNVLHFHHANVHLDGSGSAMKMVFGLGLVAYVFAFGTPLRGYVRLIILVVSPILAVAANVLRMVPAVWLYGHGPRAVADAFYVVSGWMMLVLAFALLLGIIRLLKWAMIPVTNYRLAYD